jgi:hypothetical protein
VVDASLVTHRSEASLMGISGSSHLPEGIPSVG